MYNGLLVVEILDFCKLKMLNRTLIMIVVSNY